MRFNGNYTQVGLEYIPWRTNMSSSINQNGGSSYAYSFSIIGLYVIIIAILVTVQLRRWRYATPTGKDYYSDDYRDNKKLLEESKSLLRLSIRRMRGVKDGYLLDQMPNETV
jgi:hypothetical protein